MVENEEFAIDKSVYRNTRLEELKKADKNAVQMFFSQLYDSRMKLFGQENADKWQQERKEYYQSLSRKVKAYEKTHNVTLVDMYEVRKRGLIND